MRSPTASVRLPWMRSGLNSALEGLCRSFTARTQMPVSYVGMDTAEISNPIDICLYRILQEGLDELRQTRTSLSRGKSA